jgi:tetratricopeptide (TPR) repeat protein
MARRASVLEPLPILSSMKAPCRDGARLSAACVIARMFPAVRLTALALFLSSSAVLPAKALQISIPPQSLEHLALRAEQLENEGRWEDAESVYRQILKIDPRSIAALNRLGAIEVRRGQFGVGIGYYKQALQLNPSEFGTNLNLGIAYIKKQDYRSAVAPLERAAQEAPESFQAHELLAGALVGQNDFSRAVPQLEKASELNPNDVATLYLLERSYLETKQFAKALPAFERLQSLDPSSPWVRILRGQAEDAVGNYQKAIEEFEQAREQLPRDATVRFSLGFMYWKTRRFPEAESEIQHALQLDPEFEEAKYYLADTYILEQKPAAALPLLEALVRVQPKDARALADRGKALEELNRDAEAALAYEACLSVDAERADVHYRLARVYKKLKRSDAYVREIATAQRLQQKKREEQETLMQASGARGDPSRQGEGHLRLPASNDKSQ